MEAPDAVLKGNTVAGEACVRLQMKSDQLRTTAYCWGVCTAAIRGCHAVYCHMYPLPFHFRVIWSGCQPPILFTKCMMLCAHEMSCAIMQSTLCINLDQIAKLDWLVWVTCFLGTVVFRSVSFCGKL